jgi:hypothetical protein
MQAVRCDGVVDCKLKSDELGCGKEARHGEYVPMCARVRQCVHACVCVYSGMCKLYYKLCNSANRRH